MPSQKRSALQSLVKKIADSNGRRLQAAMMSSDCQAACPGVVDFLTAMGEAAGGDDAAMMDMMCANVDVLTCIAAETVCQDDGTQEITELVPMLGCICACPAVVSSDIEMKGQDLTAEECKIVKCVQDTAACKAVEESADADAKKSMDSCGAGGSSS